MKKRGQIWIETVVYTLIALIMIGAVLAFARPKIQEMQDKIIIDQTIEALEEIDSTLTSITNGAAGTQEIINIEIKKGELKIIPSTEEIIFTLKESKSTYSEPGKEVSIGKILIKTEQTGKTNTIILKLQYASVYDLIYDTTANQGIFGKSPSPYKLILKNSGRNGNQISVTITNG